MDRSYRHSYGISTSFVRTAVLHIEYKYERFFPFFGSIKIPLRVHVPSVQGYTAHPKDSLFWNQAGIAFSRLTIVRTTVDDDENYFTSGTLVHIEYTSASSPF